MATAQNIQVIITNKVVRGLFIGKILISGIEIQIVLKK